MKGKIYYITVRENVVELTYTELMKLHSEINFMIYQALKEYRKMMAEPSEILEEFKRRLSDGE